MKAMHKQPERRYVSAAALRDDLRAVLEARPVQARMPGWLRRARVWIARYPVIATLFAVMLLLVSGFIALVVVLAAVGEPKVDLPLPGGATLHIVLDPPPPSPGPAPDAAPPR